MKKLLLLLLICMTLLSCTKDVVVTTKEPKKITSNSAVLKGSVHGDNIKDKGILYCQCKTPELDQAGPTWPGWQDKFSDGAGTGSFSFNNALFVSNTTYYFRTYAITDEEVYYGDIMSFTTLSE